MPAGKRRVVRVLVDRAPYAVAERHRRGIEGLGLDEVAEVTRVEQLDRLEEADPMGGSRTCWRCPRPASTGR